MKFPLNLPAVVTAPSRMLKMAPIIRTGRFAALLLLCSLFGQTLLAYQTTTTDTPDDNNVSVPGGIYTWELPSGVTNITFNRKAVFSANGHAFVGIPMKAKPGPAEISYQLAGVTKKHRFEVFAKQYTEQHITIKNKNLVNPPQRDLTRIRDEAKRQRELYVRFDPELHVENGFSMPLEGIVTSLFGHRRFFNGEPRNPHSGLDIAADQGTPILAAGNATVTLAEELFFNGNTLFLDHGRGLITMYCHMHELLVAVGDRVEKGQSIGLVGATGRATGPHLHWSVSLNGTRVDPQSFLAQLNQTVVEPE